ncbi:MAG: Ig-like domain-containing protein [Anaerolineae bacterium]|nr:Ig-like domain-containing protein [Anaerolineae bacterium]
MSRNRRVFSVFIALFIVVSLACTFSLPTNIPFIVTPTATPLSLPPAIVETDPPPGSQIGVQQGIAFFFNQPMQRASVEAALKMDKGDGIYTWIDDSTLTFTPLQPLPADSAVTFTLAPGATAANGLARLEPWSITFNTTPALSVTQTLPAAEAEDIRTDSAVVVAFNQPVVALGADQTDLPAGFSLEPATGGRGEWLNTSTYIFHPDPALQGGAAYTVRVNPALQSLAGLRLETSADWSFRTSLPRVVDAIPYDNFPLGREPEIAITFNQPMDKASVEADLQFEGPGGKINGNFEWNENATEMVFKPEGRLLRATSYRLGLSSASLARGGQGLQAGIQRNYITYPEFGVSFSEPYEGGVKKYDENVVVHMTAPLGNYLSNELEKLVTVSPPVSNFWISASDEVLYLYGIFDPEFLYTVTISGDLQDRWGSRLGADYTLQLRSNPPAPALMLPYQPVVMVHSEDPRLSAQVTNLTYLDVSIGEISLEDFFRLNNDYQAREVFQPAEVSTWRETVAAGTGTSAYAVPLTEKNSALRPGLYFVRITSGQLNTSNQPLFILSSNVNLTLKVAADSALVWAADSMTGEPKQFYEVAVYDGTGQVIDSGKTDVNGLWRSRANLDLDISETYYAMLREPASQHFSLTATDFNNGISPWDFDIPTQYYDAENEKVYLYTDRPIYRPGDVVSFRGVARHAFNGRYSDIAQSIPWTVSLYDVQGREVESAPVNFSEYGTFSGQLSLPDAATPGGWRIEVKGNPGKWGNQTHAIYFDVADYRKPEINLSVAMTPQDALAGQAVQATVRADYFFGAPTGDLPFTWRLYREREYFDIPGFQSGTYTAYWLGEWQSSYGIEIASGQARTGPDGAFNLDLGELEPDNTSRFTLEVTALESGGFPLSARESVVIHPAATYPGIRLAQWVGRAGEPLEMTLTTVGIDKTPVANKTLKLDLQKVTWTMRPGDETSYSPRYERQVETVENGQATTAADGLVRVAFTPPDPGTYLLRAEVDGNVSEALVWVGGEGQAIWPATPYDRLQLTAGQTQYQPGQTASIFIPNPFNKPAPALVTTERGSILSAQRVDVPADGLNMDFWLSDENAPNTYISVTLIGPEMQFRQGYINLEVDPLNFVLNVELKATPEKARPGENVQFDLRVTDSKDQPVQGEFSLAVVDLAALALANPNAPDIVPAFYDIQPLAVRTGLTNAVYTERIMPMQGGMGGGGGDMAPVIREEFPDTALWATFVTGADGTAKIDLTLPDSLTTWQVETRGLDHETRVGQARLNLVTSKELLLRPITPRYLVVGDRARVSTYVNNNTANALKAEVTLKATGANLEDAKTATQKVDLPANGRALLSWWVSAGDAQSADFVFSVKAGNLTDATRPTDGSIPILRYTSPQAFVTAGILPAAGMQTEIVSLPRSFMPLGGDLTIELSPSLGTYLLDATKSLPEPDAFSSNEAIASYLMANLSVIPALREAGTPATELAQRQRSIIDWAGKLAAQQNSDGGWNWYKRGMWGENPSDPFISAYVTYALGLVEQNSPSGLEFSIQRAKEYLASQMVFDFTTPDVELDEQAFILLAYYGTPTGQAMGSLETASLDSAPQPLPIDELFELRERLSPLGQAYLALAYLGMDSAQPARTLLDNLATTANRSASGAFWENQEAGWQQPGSPVYTTAVIVHALGRVDPASPLLTDAIRYLAASRSATRAWGGAMQNAWVLKALSSALVGTGEFAASFPFSATLNSLEIARGQAASPQALTTVTNVTPLSGLHPQNPNELKILRENGNGKLYYRAILNVLRPVESAPAINQGIAISRAYYNCSTEPCQPVQAWQMMPDTVGKITVRVTISLPHDMYYLNVEDFAPAGAEIVNPVLKTAEQGQDALEVEYFSPDDPYASGWGWWYFDSPRIYSDHVQWTSDYLPAGTYVLTYTLIPSLPGQYRALPAHAWMTYFPEVQGTSSGSVFEIRE